MLSRFHLIPERYGRTDEQTDGRTDRQTDIFAISISRVSVLTRDKNQKMAKKTIINVADGNITSCNVAR